LETASNAGEFDVLIRSLAFDPVIVGTQLRNARQHTAYLLDSDVHLIQPIAIRFDLRPGVR